MAVHDDDDGPLLPWLPWVPSLRGVLLTLAVIAVGLGAWTLLAATSAKSQLTAARADLDTLRKYSNVDRRDVEQHLARDLSRTRHARDRLHQFGPSLVARIPLLGRSVVAERTVSDASAAAVEAGLTATHAADTIGSTGHVDLAQLATSANNLRLQAEKLRGPLRRLAHLNTNLTPSPIGHGVHQAQDALLGLDSDLARAAEFTSVLGDLLGAHGPRTVLVALQNNSELRATGGLISTFAFGTARDGHLQMGRFQDVERFRASPDVAKPVPAPPEYVKHYGPYLGNTTLWKDVNFDPDVPTSAEVLTEVAAATTHRKADVVIMIDVPAMADIVGATGPITLTNGRVLNKDQLTQALLVDAYASHADTVEGQTQRRLQLEDAASHALRRLTGAHVSLKLVRTLANLASGRHVSIWSSNPAEEQVLNDVGVSGSVNADGHDMAMVSLTNLGDSLSPYPGKIGSGNKLDYYGYRDFDLEVVVGPSSARVVETFTLRNKSPAVAPKYVTGPRHPGRMHELMSFSTALNARIESLTRDGKVQLANFDTEHGYRRLAFAADLERGKTATWRLIYDVPLTHGIYQLNVIPQPVANIAMMRVTVTAEPGRQLDSLTGGVRAQNGVVDINGPWLTTQHIAVRVHERTGWAAFKHAVADFFTKPLG